MMSRFHLIFVILFIGGLSAVTNADSSNPPVKRIQMSNTQQKQVMGKIISLVGETVTSVAEQKNIIRPVEKKPAKEVTSMKSALGVSQIVVYKDGPICTGIHLKPWILLTTADCVYNRTMKMLAADITYFDTRKEKYMRKMVEIDSIDFDPMYKQGNPQNNLALLYVYAQYEWEVQEFTLPFLDLKPDYFVSNRLVTHTNLWNFDNASDKYYAVEAKRMISKDYSDCGELGTVPHWFCAEKQQGKDHLAQVDVGIPLYYYKGPMKRLFALFSGWNLKKTFKGHLYQSVYPSFDWIDEYIHEHPLPPFARM